MITKRSTCTKCGQAITYNVFNLKGLWSHTERPADNHDANTYVDYKGMVNV